MSHDFYLASRSSRRIQLLRDAGYRFESIAPDVVELARPGEAPGDFAQRMALDKANAVREHIDPEVPRAVLAADTDVSVDGRILGKPLDRTDAIDMLLRLSNRSHEVHTAVAVCLDDCHFLHVTCTEVVFGPITEREAARYWESGEPADKAGGYAIQGGAGRWVKEIHGSYTGVVGLPMFETMTLLRRFGVEPVLL